jgi:fumarylpyruvate hydrolase
VQNSSALFPVRRIFCVGRNYAEHAIEMGSDPTREPPFYFTKPADAVLTRGADMPYPSMTKDLHHEMELVVAIGAGGVDISIGDALEHVWGYCAGLDMTRRDLQGEAKKTGRPWDMGKGFDLSAPMGAIMPKGAVRPVEGPHPAQRERRAAPGERPVQADLVGAGGDRQPFDARAPDARRPHHDRHAENVAAVQRGDLLEGFVEGVGEVRTRIA